MPYISIEEAKDKGLPGFDLYKRTQLAYKDDLHRDHLAVSLNIEALKIFGLSVTLGQQSQLETQAQEVRQQLIDGSFSWEKYPISEQHWRLMEYMNLENFYIATGFELHFKSWLLQNDFIINCIDRHEPFRELRKEQSNRPIGKSEFFRLTDFQYDTLGQINILPGITEQSLSFNTICNCQNYSNALEIEEDLILIVEDYRNLRNQIHLPGDVCETPNINRVGQYTSRLLIDYINERVVNNSNHLIVANNFNFQPLPKL